MKITTFNPLIITRDPEPTIKLFEELGFKRQHTKQNISEIKTTDVRMKDANGFYLDVARVESMPRDMTTMRMNVSDFDEAYELLKAHGFKNARGEDHTIDSKSARSCLMVSSSGFSIQLTQHIKD